MKVYLHLGEGFEEIEAITVVDVLRRADIDIFTVSITGEKEVEGAHGIIVMADQLFEETDYSAGDMIVLPGGMPGTKNLEEHCGLREKIKAYADQGKWISAICAAPKVLGKLGVLKDKAATCYPGFEDDLAGASLSKEPVVQSGKVITSRGPGTAIQFSLKIVEQLKGVEKTRALKEAMIV